MWIDREIAPCLRKIAAKRPALVVTGARQTGKTSLLARLFADHGYVSLDVPMVADEAEQSGETFLQHHPPPLVIDEVQYAPRLLRHIKADIDRHRQHNGRFLITGSQRFDLMQGVTESLAGRAAVLTLHSLSAREYVAWFGKKLDRSRLLQWIVRGGYPELHAADLEPGRFYADYVATYLERDVRSALNVRSLRDFDRFLRLCAARTGQLVSSNALAADVGVAANTIRAWLSVLEASGLVQLLEPYFENLGRRVVKTPKLYFLDTGLVCHLTGLRSVDQLEQSPLLGPIFETHVLGQLVRHFHNRGESADLFFLRDHDGREIDFVVGRGGKLMLIECKLSEQPVPSRGLHDLRERLGPKRVLSTTLITPQPGRRKLGHGLTCCDSVALDFLDGNG